MLDAVTVVVGNRAEVEVAVGTAEPHEAAKRLLDRGVELALVKMGGEGVLVATPDEATVIRSASRRGGLRTRCRRRLRRCAGARPAVSGWDPVRCAQYANAAGAIVASRLACADAMPTAAELEAACDRRSAVMTTTTEISDRTGPNLADAAWQALVETRATDPDAVARAYASRRPPGPAPERPRLGLPRRRRPPCSRGPGLRRAMRWRWRTGGRCSPGSSRP